MVRPAMRLSQGLRIHRQNLARPRQQSRFASSTPGGSGEKKTEDAVATAQKYAGQAVAAGQKLLGPIGDRISSMLGAYRQPIVYNLSVTREFLKQVYVAERLQPPTSLSAISSAYQTIWSRASSPTFWRQLSSSGDALKLGVYAVEAYAVFKVGEIVGRRSLVGYKLD